MNNSQTQITVDQFKHVIEGIGPGIEKRLHQAGINTYEQLGQSSPIQIFALIEGIPGMSVERITELDWPGKARQLASEHLTDETVPPDMPSNNRQYDASFTVKFLLNEDHSVRAIRVADNRKKSEVQWAEWDENRLIDFFVQNADLKITANQSNLPTKKLENVSKTDTTTDEVDQPEKDEAQKTRLGGRLHMHDLEIVPADTNHPSRILRHGVPFGVQLNLDLTEIEAPDESPIAFTAAIYARNLEGREPSKLVGESRNTITPGSRRTIRVSNKPLKPGSYRLDAIVTLQQSHDFGSFSFNSTPKAFLDGGILKVY